MSPTSPPGLGAAPRLLLLALLCLAPPAAAPPPPSAPTGLPGPPGTAPGPPQPRSEAPVLSLNLGLNFKIKVRSQGGPRLAAPPDPPPPPLPPGTPTLPPPSGSGWPDPGDEPGSGTPPEEAGGWGGPPGRAGITPPASPAGERDKELELDIAIDLTAGLDPEAGPGGGAVPPTSLLRAPPGPPHLIPGIKAGISELASKLSAAGFLVPTVPPRISHEVPGGNGSQEHDQAGSGAEPAHPPGRQPSRGAVPPPAAASACTPGSTCSSGGPDPRAPPPAPLSWPPHFVALQTSWPVATAAWGPAWDAHVYGVGCLFALLGLLGLLVLLGGRGGRPPAARLMGGLLAVAGAARAFPLFFDAYERHGRLPPPAARLLFELPFPCLGWGLALALCLPCPPRRCRTPAMATLGVLHAGGVLGAVLAVAVLGRLPGLLLVPRGLFAGLAAALTLWVLPRCGGGGSRGGPQGKGGAGSGGGGGAVGVAAAGAVLSAGLQVFGASRALGWGGTTPLGPWAWWGLQLGCRLAEAAMGLPLAVLALVAAPRHRHPQALDTPRNGCAPRPRGEAEALPLCGGPPENPEADGDPTAGYRPPSPIDLRRSIDEALGARPGIFRHGAGAAAGISVIGTAGIGADGTAGAGTRGVGATGLPGIGTTTTLGLGADGTAGTSTTATPSLGTTGAGALGTGGAPGRTTTGETGLGATGTPGLAAAGAAGIGTTGASGLGTTTTPSLGTTGAAGPGTTGASGPGTTGASGPGTTGTSGPGTTSASGPGTTSASGPGTTGTPELSTTSTPSLGTASTAGLGKTTVPGLGTTGTAGFGTTATPNPGTTGTSEPNTAGTQGLGTTATPDLSTTAPPEPGTAGPPAPPAPSALQRAASCGGGSAASPGVRGRRGGSPSPRGLCRGVPTAVPDPSPPPRGTPQAAPALRPSRSWAGGSPQPLPAPQSQGGQAGGGVPEPPGADRRSQCSDTIDL